MHYTIHAKKKSFGYTVSGLMRILRLWSFRLGSSHFAHLSIFLLPTNITIHGNITIRPMQTFFLQENMREVDWQNRMTNRRLPYHPEALRRSCSILLQKSEYWYMKEGILQTKLHETPVSRLLPTFCNLPRRRGCPNRLNCTCLFRDTLTNIGWNELLFF